MRAPRPGLLGRDDTAASAAVSVAASAAAEAGLGDAPGCAEAWALAGQVRHLVGRSQAALAAFDRCEALSPGHEAARLRSLVAAQVAAADAPEVVEELSKGANAYN